MWTAYTTARKYGWLKDMIWLGRKRCDKWTLEEIKEEVKSSALNPNSGNSDQEHMTPYYIMDG